jgi:hypothetical protein
MNNEGRNIVFLQLYVLYINHFEMYFVLDGSPHVELELHLLAFAIIHAAVNIIL